MIDIMTTVIATTYRLSVDQYVMADDVWTAAMALSA